MVATECVPSQEKLANPTLTAETLNKRQIKAWNECGLINERVVVKHTCSSGGYGDTEWPARCCFNKAGLTAGLLHARLPVHRLHPL